jgi:hypothetical protein
LAGLHSGLTATISARRIKLAIRFILSPFDTRSK